MLEMSLDLYSTEPKSIIQSDLIQTSSSEPQWFVPLVTANSIKQFYFSGVFFFLPK